MLFFGLPALFGNISYWKNRTETSKTILISYTCPHIYMLSLIPGFANSNEIVNVKELLKV